MNILPPREYASEEEKRLADMLNASFTGVMAKADSAIRLRSAGNDAQRLRRYAIRNLEEAATNIMSAFAYAQNGGKQKD